MDKQTQIPRLSNEEFERLVGTLAGAHHQFCLNKIGHDRINNDPWKIFPYIWTTILIALRHYYLSRLANVFDNPASNTPRGTKFNLSILRPIPKENFSEDSQKTIDAILTLRNRIGSHLDSEDVMMGKALEEDYGLDFKGEKIRALIRETYSLLNQIRNEYGYTKKLDDVQERQLVEQKFEEWYKVFEEKYPKVGPPKINF